MSRVGLDWYKREPMAYLGDVQSLTSKDHAVYSIVIDLLYVHGGAILNDPKFIAGFISDMGSASVRNSLASLDANPRITLVITETEISQKRAKNEVKTKQNQRENAKETGKKGGEKSAELRHQRNEISNLDTPNPSNGIQPEKRREEKRIEERDTNVSAKKPENHIETKPAHGGLFPEPGMLPSATCKDSLQHQVPDKSPKQKPVKFKIPDDWVPSESEYNYAIEQGIHESMVLTLAEEFRVYWGDRSDRDSKKSSAGWRMCWQGNVRRNSGQQQYNKNGNRNGNGFNGKEWFNAAMSAT